MCHKWPRICSTCRQHFSILSSFMTYHRVITRLTRRVPTSRTGTAYPSGAPEFTPGFWWGSCYSIFGLICLLLENVNDTLSQFITGEFVWCGCFWAVKFAHHTPLFYGNQNNRPEIKFNLYPTWIIICKLVFVINITDIPFTCIITKTINQYCKRVPLV